MVRRKTASGVPAQSSAPIVGQTYGVPTEQVQLQQAMPTPNSRAAVATAANAAPPQAAAQAPAPDFQQLLAAAQGQGQGAGMLTQATARPNEPITTGLPIGPGAGPSALNFAVGSTPGQRFLRQLGQKLDPQTRAYLDSLADRAGR